jgi:hypothetical protein
VGDALAAVGDQLVGVELRDEAGEYAEGTPTA